MNSPLSISEAEWQIMRLIWAAASTTSHEIHKDLSLSIGWKPTTVKTLLARLLQKEIITFELKGKTRYYSPLISEETCIKIEMKSVIDKFYGGLTHLETAHFVFRGNHDPDYINHLSLALEERYDPILKDLDYTPKDKLLVYTHTTQKRLHSALGLLEGPHWLRAGYSWGILHIAPKVCFDDLPADGAAVHIFTQIMINLINPSTPYWLQQAIASYEGHWLTHERIQAAVKVHDLQSDLSPMKDMTKVYVAFKESGGYELSYTIAEYIVSVYGISYLSLLVRNPNDFEGVLGCSENEFWTRWHKYIKEMY